MQNMYCMKLYKFSIYLNDNYRLKIDLLSSFLRNFCNKLLEKLKDAYQKYNSFKIKRSMSNKMSDVSRAKELIINKTYTL